MSLAITIIRSDENLMKLAFAGKLDTLAVGQHELRFHALLNGQNTPVILDFSEVTFLASMGIRMLLVAAKDLKNQGHSLKIENVASDVRHVFETAGLTDFLI